MDTNSMNIFVDDSLNDPEEIWNRLYKKSIGKYKIAFLRDVFNQMVKYNKVNEEYLNKLLHRCPSISSINYNFGDKYFELLSQCVRCSNFSYLICKDLETEDELRAYLSCLQQNKDYNAILQIREKFNLTIQEIELFLQFTNFNEAKFLEYKTLCSSSWESLQLLKIREHFNQDEIVDTYAGKLPLCVISSLCVFKNIGLSFDSFCRLEVLFYNTKFWLERLEIKSDYIVGLDNKYSACDIELLKQVWIYLTGDTYVVTNNAFAVDEFVTDLACSYKDKDSGCIGIKKERYSRDYQYVLYADNQIVSFYEDTVPYIFDKIAHFLGEALASPFYNVVFDSNARYALGIHIQRSEKDCVNTNAQIYTHVTNEAQIMDGISDTELNKILSIMYQIGVEINYFEWNTLMTLSLLKLQGLPYLDWYLKFTNNYLALNSIFKTYVFAATFGDKRFRTLLKTPELYLNILSMKDCLKYNSPFNNAVFLLTIRELGCLFRNEEIPQRIPNNLTIKTVEGYSLTVSFEDLLLHFQELNYPNLQGKFCKIHNSDDTIILEFRR